MMELKARLKGQLFSVFLRWSLQRLTPLTFSPHNPNQLLCRLHRLWEDEVAKVGLEKASLVRVILRFQRTRMIISTLVGALAMVAVFTGPVFIYLFVSLFYSHHAFVFVCFI